MQPWEKYLDRKMQPWEKYLDEQWKQKQELRENARQLLKKKCILYVDKGLAVLINRKQKNESYNPNKTTRTG